jgi:tetratricopeptide (TPR) repeat protein
MRPSSIHWTDRLTYLVCRVLNRLGMRHKYAGRFTAAERAYRGAMALALTRPTPDAAVLADLYHNLGGLEHARRRFAAADPLARRAVELRTLALGAHHPAVGADCAALAPILDALGHFEAAELLLRQALHVLAPDHKDIAPALNNLAAIRHRAGAPREAEQLYRRALALKQRQHGPRHRDLAPTLNNLATLLREQGRAAEAVTLYQRALEILERSVERNHPSLAICRANAHALC